MLTRQQLRELALALPGAEEKSHFGKPDFRVKNKIFAGLTHEAQQGYFKARPELRDELLASRSGAFTPAAGAWGRSGWTYVDLRKVQLGLLRELLLDAWKLVAPAKLVAAHDAVATPSASSPKRIARAAPQLEAKRGGKAKPEGKASSRGKPASHG